MANDRQNRGKLSFLAILYLKGRKYLRTLFRRFMGLKSSNNLTPVPSNSIVLRLARLPKDYQERGNILAIQLSSEFELSTVDKESIPPHLSVWVESFTTPKQAYSFLAENSSRKLVLRLPVDEIRKLIGYAGDDKIYPNLLEVLWIHLFITNSEGKKVKDTRLGADGHSGITGLDSHPQELTKREAKNLRKDLRSKLAEIASKDHYLLDLNK